MSVHLWLRAETKPLEERTALPPQYAKQLIEHGYSITVEHCPQRVFDIESYRDVGCTIVEAHSWQSDAPIEAVIFGLKEFSDTETFALKHKHIQFAHAYKEQKGWKNVLTRFTQGGGTLYDLEFLVDDNARRVAAFGYWAGYSGCAVAVMEWIAKRTDKPLGALSSYPNREALLNDIRLQLAQLDEKPSVIILGAKGRSGSGALDFANALSLQISPWDMAETAKGGPFPEILEHNIFVNCVFVQKMIPPFISLDMLQQPNSLEVICDVSCDPFGEYNPLPIYSECTSFSAPSVIVTGSDNVSLVAIDHLPSLLPKESSEDFCQQLLPTLLAISAIDTGVWGNAKATFKTHSTLATQ